MALVLLALLAGLVLRLVAAPAALAAGTGTFRPAVHYGAGDGPASVAVGDFDGDSVSVLLGNGDGTFRAATSYGTGDGPFSVAAGDFDGDDTADLAAANFGGDSGSVLLNNTAPVAAGDSYATAEDTRLTVPAPGVLANDSDMDGAALTAALVSGPANGVLTPDADGSFSYTPNANFVGTVSFAYRASDGALTSNVATVTSRSPRSTTRRRQRTTATARRRAAPWPSRRPACWATTAMWMAMPYARCWSAAPRAAWPSARTARSATRPAPASSARPASPIRPAMGRPARPPRP